MRTAARDYKSPRRRSIEMRRMRDAGAGALIGIVLAVGATLLYMNNRHGAAHDKAEQPVPTRPRAAPVDADSSGATAAQKYDFYQMLPNSEVVVPEKDKEAKRDPPTAASTERPGVYVLQAGSYRNESDADRIRDRLAAQGIDAKVQRVAVDADVWHRVRIGPIDSLDQLNRTRRQLQAANIDALVIRVGD